MTNINNKLPSHFKDFINQLNRHKVKYLLVGGYAMGAYGHIRATNDLDIYIQADEENASKMIQACVDYGIAGSSIEIDMFLVARVVGIGEPPLRIEILKKLDVDFQYAYQRSKTIIVDAIPINIVNLEDLVLLKESAVRNRNRSRDSEDLSYLKKLKQKGSG